MSYLTSAQRDWTIEIQSESGDSQALQDFIAWISTGCPLIFTTPLECLTGTFVDEYNSSLRRFTWEVTEFVEKWRLDNKAPLAYLCYEGEYKGAELSTADILKLTGRLFTKIFKHYEVCGGTGEMLDAAAALWRSGVRTYQFEDEDEDEYYNSIGDEDPMQYAQAPEDAQDVIVIN